MNKVRASPRKKKTTSKVKDQTSKKPNRICRRCEGKPSIYKCIHTKVGRAYLENLGVKTSVNTSAPPPSEIGLAQQDPPRLLHWTTTPDQHTHNPPPIQQGYIPPAQLPSTYWNPGVPGLTHWTPPNVLQHPPFPLTSTSNPFESSNDGSIPIDPFLDDTPTSSRAVAFIQETPAEHYTGSSLGTHRMTGVIPQPNFRCTDTGNDSELNLDGSSSSDTDESDGDSPHKFMMRTFQLNSANLHQITPASTPAACGYSANKTAAQKKKANGMVEGAMRGGRSYEIIRPRPLPEPKDDQATATRRFRTVIGEIIAKAERAAVETRSWIFVGAQHPNAAQPFLHYTSPKLRAESLEDAEELVELFGQTVGHLISARRTDIVQQSRDLVKAEKAKVLAIQEARNARHLLAEQSNQNAALIALLKSLNPDIVIPPELSKNTPSNDSCTLEAE